MKNYTMYPVKENGESLWVVKEITTDQVVDKYAFKDDAVGAMKFLNNGGGFNGFTPSFMVRRVAAPWSSLDEAFAHEFSTT